MIRHVALYARVSTGNQATGLESQVRALKTYCESNKIENFQVYSDENVSGAKASRPQLDRLMTAVERGEVSAVIVFSFSRFARSTKHLLAALELFNSKDIGFVSLSEKIDTSTTTGKFVFSILAAVSELERTLIQERVRNGIANARAKNKQIGRPKTRNTDLIKALLAQGLTYREIAKLAHCSHWSIQQTAKEMNKPTSSENAASEVSVQNRLVG